MHAIGRPFRHEPIEKCEQILLHKPLSDVLDLRSTLFRACRTLTSYVNLHVVGFRGSQDFDMRPFSGRGLHVALVDLDFRREAIVGFGGEASLSVLLALLPGWRQEG